MHTISGDPELLNMQHRGAYMVTSLVLSVVGFVFVVVSFSSDYWWVTFNPKNKFLRNGIWSFCWDGYIYPRDYFRKQYHGCWYVYAKQFYWLRDLIMPPWFIACQTLEIIVILCSGISMMITLFTYWKNYNLPVAFRRTKITLGFKVVEAVAQILVLIIFAERATGDWQWMPLRMDNQLSWSYGLAVVAAFCATGAIVPVVGYFTELQEQLDQLRGKDYEMYLRGDRF